MSNFDYYDITTGQGLTDHKLSERYDEMLDEIWEPYQVGVVSYYPSEILKSVDPIAYRVGFNKWIDSELGKTITEEPPTDDEEDEEN